MKKLFTKLTSLVAALVLTATLAVAGQAKEDVSGRQRVMEKIRKELVTLPFYGVFDNLAYSFEGGTATLYGQVVRPTTKSDAERRVARIPGVERVVNRIEVLPLSSFDDSVRARAYRQIFGTGGLYRYAMGANPSVHIVVNRGHLTLEGVVAHEGDRRLARMAALQVPGVFSVTNNLRVDGEERRAR
ncbi:MAG TPA: BON domain-containing protein [Pyrinomonadaceae bacterium]|nr:BON domain-containing protein [Pyrinomonadaceae bacterium]